MLKKSICAVALLYLSLNLAGASEQSSAESLVVKGVITSSVDYRLGDTITRKEMMKIVMNLSGGKVPQICSGVFPDVENDWGCKYIEEALYQDFIAPNDTFRPNDTITKAESMKLILKARAIEKLQNTEAWQDDYMMTALQSGLISAKYFDHNTQATRGWIFDIAAIPESSNSTPTIMEVIPDAPEPVEPSNQIGIYTDYDITLVGASDTTVLFFHAGWCPSCRTANDNLLLEDVVSSGITLLKTDYDSETELRKKYGITTQHTFVQVDAKGTLIKKWNGSSSLADIQSKIQ